MEARKLLYATDLKDQALSFSLLKEILPVRELNFYEFVFLHTTTFDGWIEKLLDLNIRSKILVNNQLSPPDILSAAKKEKVSLIIVNQDKETGKTSYRSTVRQLIKESFLPILFINNGDKEIEPDEKGLFAHVILSTNWSAKSEKALKFLLGFKKILGELEIVNVIKGKLTIKEMRELKDRLAETRKICLDNEIDAESHIYAGKTSEEIITAAKDYKATMIIIGAESEKKGLSRLSKKSSSWKVACEADMPVMVVP